MFCIRIGVIQKWHLCQRLCVVLNNLCSPSLGVSMYHHLLVITSCSIAFGAFLSVVISTSFHVLKREAVEIIQDKNAVKSVDHTVIDRRFRYMLMQRDCSSNRERRETWNGWSQCLITQMKTNEDGWLPAGFLPSPFFRNQFSNTNIFSINFQVC